MVDPALAAAAERWGVQTGYWDVTGQWNDAHPEALVVVLRELGAPVDTAADALRAVDEHTRRLVNEPVEPVMVVPSGGRLGFVLRLYSGVGGVVEVDVTTEDGEHRSAAVDVEAVAPHDGGEIDGRGFAVRWIDTGIALPMGYHRAVVRVAGMECESLVLAPPERLPALEGAPMWGVFAPTYALPAAGSPGRDHLGVAHLGGLDDLGRRVDAFGGRVVSTLPLLATYLDEPFEPSPYSPVSRRWWTELHLDPARLPGLEASERARELLASSRVAEAASALASDRLVDHAAAARLLRDVLEAVVADVVAAGGATADAVAAFGHERPELGRYARFRAMVEQYGLAGVTPVADPPPRLDPARVDLHRYVQYAVETQMDELAASFRSRDQLLALDLPLGANPDGFDVWSDPGNFARVSTGAPPDDLFRGGQNWGFPPPHPVESRARGHRELVLAVRHHLRHTGLLRVDHLMSLERLWWIPPGFAATEGVYVRYRTDELMAVLAIEATRAEAVLVGENLGTVTDDINEAMGRWGMLGMYELQFEPWSVREQGRLRPPGRATAAGLNTHDMPTFAGWWAGNDLETSVELGLIDPADLEEHRDERVADREALARGLAADLGVEVAAEPGPVLRAALEWLGASAADVVLATLEDLWLEDQPQNVPGTHHERPNWRRRFDRNLDTALAEPLAVDSLGALDRARRSDASREEQP